MAIPIHDLTCRPHKEGKRLRYEVGVIHRECDLEDWRAVEVEAKFRRYGAAMLFAKAVSEGNMYYAGVVVRS